MKKLALVTALLLTFLLTTNISLAKDDTSVSPFRVRKEAVEQKKTEFKENIVEKREEVKENLVLRRRENLAKFLSKMIARLKAMASRLQVLITRIESRIEKIASENPDEDLTSIKADVEKAQVLLKETGDKISELETTGDELLESDTPKTVFEEIRKKLSEIKKGLVEVHRILVHVIGDIKGLRVGDDKNETE